jgi:hypothetical protein
VREIILLAVHLLVTPAKLLRPGGVRAVAAESLLLSHPFVERLIGTNRRERLDRVLFWNAVDLARKLEAFRDYYNDHRVHRARGGLTPAQIAA